MATRRSTGGIVEKATSRGTSYGIRYRAGGRRVFQLVGNSADGTTRDDAERELAFQLALIARGEWRPPVAEPEPVQEIPSFHEFASAWHARRKSEGLRPNTLEHLRWTLVDHLLPYFHPMRLDEIGIAQVDAYVQHKVREGRLGHASINRTLAVLAAVLETAQEYEFIAANPAKGKRRKLPTSKPARVWLEPGQVRALLDAAGELDGADRAGRRIRRPLLATLARGAARRRAARAHLDGRRPRGGADPRPRQQDGGRRAHDRPPARATRAVARLEDGDASGRAERPRVRHINGQG